MNYNFMNMNSIHRSTGGTPPCKCCNDDCDEHDEYHVSLQRKQQIKQQHQHQQQQQPHREYRHCDSFTKEEKLVLSSLLIDDDTHNISTTRVTSSVAALTSTPTPSLTDDMLFTNPFSIDDMNVETSQSIETISTMEYDRYHIPQSASSKSMDEGWSQQPLTIVPSKYMSRRKQEAYKSTISPPRSRKKEASKSTSSIPPRPQKQKASKPTVMPSRSRPLPPLGKVKRTKTVYDTSTDTAMNCDMRDDKSSATTKKSTPQRPKGINKRSRNKTTGSPTSKSSASILNKNTQPNSKNHSDLWTAHHRGILPSFFRKDQKDTNTHDDVDVEHEQSPPNLIKESYSNNSTNHTDDTVCKSKGGKSHSTESSWADDEEEFMQYDCWQILRDEYAQDYGFRVRDCGSTSFAKTFNKGTITGTTLDASDAPQEAIIIDDDDDDDSDSRQFKILGTSVEDLSAQPHVLSPPLMDSLLNFVPASQSSDNFWLKYSLVRDGSNLDTFRQYTRAAPYTILAIQTTEGDVFGCFTTSPWETHARARFGNGESFVWKMRYNRGKTECYSLYDQAHLESEIDVYPYSGFNDTVQLCTNTMIALGGTEIEKTSSLGFNYQDYQQQALPDTNTKKNNPEFKYKNSEAGFAIALHDDLCRGTSAPCPTFCSPSLLSDGGESFVVQNLEVYAFTPCDTVNEAQKLEMRKYFVSHNSAQAGGSSPKAHTTRSISSSPVSEFSSKDLVQGQFYRRLGGDSFS